MRDAIAFPSFSPHAATDRSAFSFSPKAPHYTCSPVGVGWDKRETGGMGESCAAMYFFKVEITPEIQARIQTLSIAQLEDLGEALLDFTQPSDLTAWLESHQA